jgi:integrase/recombinase XerD
MTRNLAGPTIRAKLAALSSLYDYLCARHAVPFNPVKGVSRPRIDSHEGTTPAISDAQVRALLSAPRGDGIKAKRDRAILRIRGKGEKLRYIPVHSGALGAVSEYLEAAGHSADRNSPLFKPVRANAPGSSMQAARMPSGVYRMVKHYGKQVGISVDRFGPHVARVTAATNALDQGADIAKVQEWLGHANVSTTRVYDHRRTRPEDPPTFKVSY